MMLSLHNLSLVALVIVASAMIPFSGPVVADALDNLKAERLEAVRQSVVAFRAQRTEVARTGPFQEHRANLHVHSHWSHDSVGTVEEIVAAARAAGTSVLMFSEHPADHYDFYVDGNQGLKGLSEHSVRECLDAGRAFVAFDWIADSTGFDFAANVETVRHEMGSQVTLSPKLALKAVSPLPVHWRLIRNGEVVLETDGSTLNSAVTDAGVYRCEAWLDVAGVRMIWILSNPIYVAGA